LDSSVFRHFGPDRLAPFAALALRNGPRAAAWTLSALIVLQVLTFGRWWTGIAQSRSAPTALDARRHPTGQALANQIIAARLFGSAPEKAREGVEPSDKQYALKGIIYLGASGDGFAILASHDGKSKTFRTGESIVPGLALHEVQTDYVVLADEAQLRRLTLPHGALLQVARIVAGGTDAAGSAPQAGASFTPDTRATLETFGLSIVQDGNGAIAGLSGKGSESWHRSGLLPTDVIVAIDGTPVADVLQEPYAIDRAGMAAVTTLTVLRAGMSTTIEAEPERGVPANRRRRSGG
jgi:hypothetical protein